MNACAEQGNLERKYKKQNAEFSASLDPFQSIPQTPNTNTVTPMSSSFYDELPPSNYIFAETAMANIHGTRLIQHIPRENQHLIPFTLAENQTVLEGVSVRIQSESMAWFEIYSRPASPSTTDDFLLLPVNPTPQKASNVAAQPATNILG